MPVHASPRTRLLPNLGSGKENGYATYWALAEQAHPGYKAIRHMAVTE